MKLNQTSMQLCVFALACASGLAGCGADAGLDGETETDIAQTAQALVDTQTRQNGNNTDRPVSARATCTVQTFADGLDDRIAQIDCDITDTLADSHSVYVDWQLDGFAPVRLANHVGSDPRDNPVHFTDARINLDGSFGTIRWHVCTDVQFGGDDCSDDVSYEL